MENKDYIAILLTEYNTLRSDVMNVRAYVIQACSIGLPLFLGLVGLSFSLKIRWQKLTVGVTALIFLIALVAITVHGNHQTCDFTKQLRELEAKVNRLADQRLLTWETDHGWGCLLWPTNKQMQSP